MSCAETIRHERPGGKKAMRLSFCGAQSMAEEQQEMLWRGELRSDQAGLADHVKATGVCSENIRGVTHDMSQEQGARKSGDSYTSDWTPGWVKWVERKQADQVGSPPVSKSDKTPWPESLKRRESTAVKVKKNFPKLTTMATNLKESYFLQKVFPDLRSGTNFL